jgi:hypothetical protein
MQDRQPATYGNDVSRSRNAKFCRTMSDNNSVAVRHLRKSLATAVTITKMQIIQAFNSDALKVAESDRLWRYMKLTTFFFLLRGWVFIPSLRRLRDAEPKEGLVPWESPMADDISLGVADDALWWGARSWVDEKVGETRKRHPHDFRVNGPLCNEQRARLEVWYRELEKRRMAWCWHKSEHESMALWNMYAHQGVAIGSDLAAIRRGLGLGEDWQALIGLLDYKRPDWSDWNYLERNNDVIMGLSRPFMFKSIDYRHEEEVRLVLKLDSHEENGLRITADPTSLLKEVVISPYIIPAEQSVLVETLEKVFEGTSVEIRQSMGRSRGCYTSALGERYLTELLKPPVGLQDSVVSTVRSGVPAGVLHPLPFAEEKDIPDLLKKL